jgi:urease accessory protein
VLEVFKSLPTTEVVVRPGRGDTRELDALTAGYAHDTITLGWEDRLKGRGRRRTDAGVEFGTTLARGTVLRGGDLLVVEALRLLVAVIERAEPVLVVVPNSAADWGLDAYHLGNGHQPVMFTDREIVCLDTIGAAQILDQHGVPFVRDLRPFTPLGLLADHRH